MRKYKENLHKSWEPPREYPHKLNIARIYSVSQTLPEVSDIFSKTVGNFQSNFYTPIIRSYLC